MEKATVTAVSYLNTLPYVWGLTHSPSQALWSLSLDVPSACAAKVLQNEADLGLTPVAVLPDLLTNYDRLDWGIAADGKVSSVFLFSKVPLEKIRSISMDTDSRTSVLLVRVLAAHHWNIDVTWDTTCTRDQLIMQKSAVMIGDKAIAARKLFPYAYDLAEEWKKMTALPFVFAIWTAKKSIATLVRKQFEEALLLGTQHIGDA
jgi:chorismate dehydratase